MILNITITLLFVFLNAFFVAAEFAIVKIRTSQLEVALREGSKLAKIALNMHHNLDAYLSATQLGITLSSLGLGWIGESVVAEIIRDAMMMLGINVSPELAHGIALPAAFVTITMLHIVFGELAPKSLAIQRSMETTMAVAIPLRVFYIIFKPAIWSLNSLANFFLRLLGFRSASEFEGEHSSEELRLIIEQSTKTGVIDDEDHKLLENVFEFSETPVKQIMVPRGRIYGIEFHSDINEILDQVIDEGYSRMPVYEKTIDNIVGVIYAKDLITIIRHESLIHLNDIIRPAFFVGEDDHIKQLLHRMQKKKFHMAIVLDEFGGTAGIVSLEDIIEELVGEIQDEYDEEDPLVEQINEREFKITASVPIDDINDMLPVPLPEADDYETLGGLINNIVGRIPEVNELIVLDSYEFRILKRSKRTIETVYVTYKGELDDQETPKVD
jgi:CBS domain containing-hemolysin-like protein